MTDFALCRTCPEITTGRQDSSKGWLLDASSNHHHCTVKPFGGDLAELPTPIRNIVLRLGAGAPIRDVDISMLKLGIALEDEWTPFPSIAPAVASASLTSPAPALESAASTRSRHVSAPTLVTAAQGDLLDLLSGGVA